MDKVIRRKEAQRYLLIDLNRTIGAEAPIYWRDNENGYTPTITQAGIYRLAEARRISLRDVQSLTLMLPIDQELLKHIEDSKDQWKLYED